MTESRPPSRDRTPIIAALITAGASVLVALIGILPNVLNQRAASSPAVPTVIVVTATTPSVRTSTRAEPTPTSVPLGILNQACPRATLAAAVGTASVTFVLANNYERSQDFYLDECLAARVDSASYAIFSVRAGTYELKNCVRGADPSAGVPDCSTNRRSVTANPYDWEIYGNAAPKENPTLLVLNRTAKDIDVFVDGATSVAASVTSHTADTILIRSSATHSIVVCPTGVRSVDMACNDPQTIQGGKASIFLIVETIK